jgi:hypothetical protein
LLVLAVDSNFDPVTRIAFEYRQRNVYPYLESKGLAVVRRQGPLARRHYVAEVANEPNVVYLTGCGHGTRDTFMGDYFDPLFGVGQYAPEESQGKIAHFLSCETARVLGPDLVRHGCRAYFGYDENFVVVMSESDNFFACDSAIDIAFAEGLTAREVYVRVIALYDKRIAELRARGALYAAATLEFDRDHLRAPASGGQWGDESAKL